MDGRLMDKLMVSISIGNLQGKYLPARHYPIERGGDHRRRLSMLWTKKKKEEEEEAGNAPLATETQDIRRPGCGCYWIVVRGGRRRQHNHTQRERKRRRPVVRARSGCRGSKTQRQGQIERWVAGAN